MEREWGQDEETRGPKPSVGDIPALLSELFFVGDRP